MNASDELDQLRGQLLATQAAIRALVLSHPDPAAAAVAVSRELNRLEAVALGKMTSEATIAGIAHAKTVLLPSASDQERLDPKPRHT